MKKKTKKYLVFTPHPDDSDFGCAGTVTKLAKEGNTVVLCVITNGNKGVHHYNHAKKKIVAIRMKEQRASAEIQGIKRVIFLNKIDGELENTKALRKEVVKVIRQERPDIVMSLDPGNKTFDNFYRFHHDHRITAETVFDAVYPEATCDVFYPEMVKKGYTSHTIKEMWCFSTDRPTMFVDISKTIDKKIEALKQHKSQIARMEELDPRLREYARKNAKKSRKKMKYAESFRIISF